MKKIHKVYVMLALGASVHLAKAQNHPFAGGSGTETDPYQIETPAQLDSIRADGSQNYLIGKHYILIADLDFADYNYADGTEANNGKGWLPIGHDTDNPRFNDAHNGTPFMGTFHGKGHVIRNLFIDREDEDYLGLFGYVDILSTGIQIIDSLGIEEVNITGRQRVGSLAGDLDGDEDDVIRSIYATGEVTGTKRSVGGLVGINSGTISKSYADVQVTGTSSVGGLVGVNASGLILNSYAIGQVTGTSSVGGLVGVSSGATINMSYAIGQVTGTGSSVGGLVGESNDIVLGSNTYISSYWNMETTGQSSSAGEGAGKVTVLTTAQMYVQSNFSGWDFTDTWLPPVADTDFPLLRSTGGWTRSTPTVFVRSTEASATEAEGASFVFSRNGLLTNPLTIDVTIAQTGNVTTEVGTATVSFPADVSMATLTVTTTDNEGDEEDERGSITVTIDGGLGYEVGDPSTATVIITDDDLPVVTIVTTNASVTEAESATFTLTRMGVLTQSLDVDITITQDGDFTTESSGTVTFAADADTYMLAVAIDDDEADEANGSITVIIDEADGANYRAGDPSTVTVTVTDDDLPIVTIVSDANVISEADGAVAFTLTRVGVLTQSLDVGVVITQDGDFTTETGTIMATFPVDMATYTLTVAIDDDMVDEADGSITATVVDGLGYTVGGPSTVTVAISDDDLPIPVVTIAASANTISEADGAVAFVLTRVNLLTQSLDVDVVITQDGNFTTEAGTIMATFAANESTTMFAVTVTDDEIHEADGSITATIANGSGYTVGDPSTATVAITDDDISAVTIAAGTSPVLEGAAVSFTLTRTVTSGAISVDVSVMQEGNYALNANDIGNRTVDFIYGSATATFIIATDDDDMDEPNGSITAIIRASTDYAVNIPASALVNIVDNDGKAVSEVTIATVANSVTEGEDVVFTLTRTPTQGALSVGVDVTQEGEYTNGTGSRTVDFMDGIATATLTIATIDDDEDEPNGTITATIQTSTGYEVGTASSASVGISDDDGTSDPEVSIAVVTSPIAEGADVKFTLTRTTVLGDLSVNVEVTQAGEYIKGTTPTTISFVDGSAVTTLTVAIDDDDVAEPNGTITATIVSGAGYGIGTPSSALVIIADNDGTAVTIATTEASVTEGEDAVFTLTRTNMSGALSVNVEVTQDGDYAADANTLGAQTVDFVDGMSTATLTISTVDDEADEENGKLTVTIGSGMGYEVGDPSSAEVSVTDNDERMAVGLRDEEGGERLYPNPVGDRLQVHLPRAGLYILDVYTLSGRRERTYRIEPKAGTASVDVSELSSGMYVVILTDAAGHSVRYRLVKQ